MNPSTSHFDLAAQQWDQRPMSQQLAKVPQRLLQLLPLQKHQHLLDFGAGTGLLASAFAPKVRHITALDSSANMLQVLDDKKIANINTLCQDVFLGLADSYDGVISCMALHHIANIERLLQTFHRHLKPRGFLALVDLYQEDGSFHGDNQGKGVHHFGFAPHCLQRQAQASGFKRIKFQEILQIQHKNTRSYPLFLMTAHV